MTKEKVKDAINTLKVVRDVWADRGVYEPNVICDADAILQSIECLEDFLEQDIFFEE